MSDFGPNIGSRAGHGAFSRFPRLGQIGPATFSYLCGAVTGSSTAVAGQIWFAAGSPQNATTVLNVAVTDALGNNNAGLFQYTLPLTAGYFCIQALNNPKAYIEGTYSAVVYNAGPPAYAAINISVRGSSGLNPFPPGSQLTATFIPSRPAGYANSQKEISAPTAPNSTSVYKMQGLAGSITPAVSGNILIMISGTLASSVATAGEGIQYQISYGVAPVPSSNGALAGTQIGAIQQCQYAQTVIAADTGTPFATQAIATGLSLGTTYWVDLAAESIQNASDVGLFDVSVSVAEI